MEAHSSSESHTRHEVVAFKFLRPFQNAQEGLRELENDHNSSIVSSIGSVFHDCCDSIPWLLASAESLQTGPCLSGSRAPSEPEIRKSVSLTASSW